MRYRRIKIRNKKNIIRGTQNPLTNLIHRTMIQKPYRFYQVKELCRIVFPDKDFTKSQDTAIREAIRKIRLNADWFCVIISGKEGYKVVESRKEYADWRSGFVRSFETDLDVLDMSDWKIDHDENLRITETKEQNPVYESIKNEAPKLKAPKSDLYNIADDGQLTLNLK